MVMYQSYANSFAKSLSAKIAVGALSKIAHMIAKEKKLHNIGEILIKSYLLKTAGFVLRKIYGKKIVLILVLGSMIILQMSLQRTLNVNSQNCFTRIYREKIVGVCIDDDLTMFGSQSKFNTKIKEKNPNAVVSYWMTYREVLSSRTLPTVYCHER